MVFLIELKILYPNSGPLVGFQFSAVSDTGTDILMGKYICPSMIISLRLIPDSRVYPFLKFYIVKFYSKAGEVKDLRGPVGGLLPMGCPYRLLPPPAQVHSLVLTTASCPQLRSC